MSKRTHWASFSGRCQWQQIITQPFTFEGWARCDHHKSNRYECSIAICPVWRKMADCECTALKAEILELKTERYAGHPVGGRPAKGTIEGRPMRDASKGVR